MKFCYLDESGTGSEIAVGVGVVIDAARMNRANRDWDELLEDARTNLSRELVELKGRSLYRGNDQWRQVDSGERTAFIESVIEWLVRKKHVVTFGAVRESRLGDARLRFDVGGFQDATRWSIAAMHVILGVQKQYQRQKNNTGNTVFVFDEGPKADELTQLVLDPPPATGAFYSRKKNQDPLDQVIDVPYFADSKHVGLIQVADLFAFLIRLYAELKEDVTEEKFGGEAERLGGWIEKMRPCLMGDAARWSKTATDSCTRFLRAAAPPSLLSVAP